MTNATEKKDVLKKKMFWLGEKHITKVSRLVKVSKDKKATGSQIIRKLIDEAK